MSTPTASLILLTYNQEQFVREAVLGALAQDYPDLEIVISDDASTDGTWAAIEAAVADYRGPHRIVTNRAPQNLGITEHLYVALALSRGDIVVGAAGDDVSRPQRVATLVAAMERSGADAAYSAWERIDAAGRSLGLAGPVNQPELDIARYFPERGANQIAGVGSAYRRSVFAGIHRPDLRVMQEDFFLSLMLAYRSRSTVFVDQPLVRYRTHSDSLTNRAASVSLLELERGGERIAAGAASILAYFLRCVETDTGYEPGYGQTAQVDRHALRRDIAFERLRAGWLDRGAWDRLRHLPVARNRHQLRWLLPRIGGLGMLVAIQRVRDRLTRR